MRRLLPTLLLAALLAGAPFALAQGPEGEPNASTGTDAGQPGPRTGNEGEAPDADESIEGPAGLIYYGALLALSLAVGAVLFYVIAKQDRNPPANKK